MDSIVYLTPLAFVFSLAAISQTNSLKKELNYLKAEIEILNDKIKND